MLKWFSSTKQLTDQEAENMLLSSQWHSYTQCIDLEKLKANMLTVKLHIETQQFIEYYFTEYEYNYILEGGDIFQSEKVKKQIRYGIPCKYTRGMIMKMFIDNLDSNTLDSNYKVRFFSIFKNRDPQNLGNHVPYMSNYESFNENLRIHFMNKKGIQIAKEVMWLLYSVVPNIEYCPLMIKLVSLSLLFLTKTECFAYMRNMILTDYQNKEDNLLRFRLRFTYEDNKRLVLSFIECFKTITKATGKEIISKMKKIGFEFETLIEDMFFNFFYGYFSFDYLHRLFMCFLREGSKILFRIGFALLKTLKSTILEIEDKNEVINIIKSKSFEMRDINSYFNLAFSFGITQYNNQYKEIKNIDKYHLIKKGNYYIPTINGDSTLMTDEDIFELWNIFPPSFFTKDAKLIYSTENFGRSLHKIYEICSDNDNSCFNCLVVIQSANKEKFGIIMSTPFDKNRTGFYKPAFINLFSLHPIPRLYNLVNRVIEKIVLCSDDKIIVGVGSEGPAIEIDKDMKVGFSFSSEVFGNHSFTNETHFEIDKIEIYILY